MDIQVLVDLGVFIINLCSSYYRDLERAPLVDLHVFVIDVKALTMDLQTLVVDLWALLWTSWLWWTFLLMILGIMSKVFFLVNLTLKINY